MKPHPPPKYPPHPCASLCHPLRHARRRLAPAWLLALFSTLLLLPDANGVCAASIDEQRRAFQQVLADQRAGRHQAAAQKVIPLSGYPLYIYYRYNDLKRRLHTLPRDEIAAFLSDYPDSYLGSRLRKSWLQLLVKRQRWAALIDFYQPQADAEIECHYLSARVKRGDRDGLEEAAERLWLSGQSRPDACDPVFAELYRSPRMTDELIWQRMRLAMDARRPGLARFVAKQLKGSAYTQAAELWQQAYGNPQRVLNKPPATDSALNREVLLFAVQRLARRQVLAAKNAYQKIKPRYQFSAADDGQVARAVAIAAAKNDHRLRLTLLDQVPASHADTKVQHYRLRDGLAARAWPQIARWTSEAAAEGTNELRWRYWRAHALKALDQTGEASALFETLANERDYYGFLAADHIDRPYQFNFIATEPTADEEQAMHQRPGVVRARELFMLGKKLQARREWYFELNRMSNREMQVAAVLATRWQWHDSAIAAMGRAKAYDDLAVRFPLLHTGLAERFAKKRGLDASRILAITRSESAFVVDAKSSAGALGLMQLMPATARETARRIGFRLKSTQALFQPTTNITLGSAYLAQMIKRYNNDFALAAAAYNAGPHRVRQWRPQSCTPAVIWIDTIPFSETRRYVRRALFYAAVYERRMQQDVKRLNKVLLPVQPSRTAQIVECK